MNKPVGDEIYDLRRRAGLIREGEVIPASFPAKPGKYPLGASVHEFRQHPDMSKLDPFTHAYVTAAIWTEEEQLLDELNMHDSASGSGEFTNYGTAEAVYDRFSENAIRDIQQDCDKFQQMAAAQLEQADELGFELSSAGHDFWLTRNGHGAGFWDRRELKGELGKTLTDLAKQFGESDLYAGDDGMIYVS